jgi:phosphopantothenoylcysteine decarboxylase/phosphopantothenate--cysteine ligase
MNSLENKNILLGVSGGIAAYKSADLVRRLKEQGADVRVVMTESAKAFITPLTMQAVSGHRVSDSLLDEDAEAGMGHIELAKWADLILIAPATANTIARLANGFADDLLSTLCLATTAPIAVAPAMNQQMWQADAVQDNMSQLQSRNVSILGPGEGEQACGDVGAGRMLEPLQLVAEVQNLLIEKPLQGLRLMLTAGPTREAIDPVRFISNHSSGKMGFAIAQAAQQMGAEVTIVTGPVSQQTPPSCFRVDVESAQQMHDAVMTQIADCDVFIACAAVADYRPDNVAEHKIKKTQRDDMTVTMVKNPDIVASVAALANGPFTVGFAAETRDVEKYARDKLKRKNLDMIAANDVARSGQGFNSDNNALSVFWPQGQQELPIMDKLSLAKELMKLIELQYKKQGAK